MGEDKSRHISAPASVSQSNVLRSMPVMPSPPHINVCMFFFSFQKQAIAWQPAVVMCPKRTRPIFCLPVPLPTANIGRAYRNMTFDRDLSHDLVIDFRRA